VDRLCDVTTQIGPGLRRRQLAGILAELRAAASVDQATAAVAADVSRAQISNFESGKYVPSRLELPALLACYGVSDRLPALEELRSAAHEPGWWSTYGLPVWLQSYVRLEDDAIRVRCFASGLVPGLLQTQDYARAVQQEHNASTAEIRRRLAVLAERQKRLGMDIAVSVVVSEALLHLTVNMGAVGVAQLDDLASTRVAEVRVLPYAAGLTRGIGHWTVLDFPMGVSSVAYEEHAIGGHLADDLGLVRKLAELYQELHGGALSADGSAALIRQVMSTGQERVGQ
jgi:DNA-binding XRE family transcriptional regulator